MNFGPNFRLSASAEQKLAPLAREGKPRQLTVLAVRGGSGRTGSGSALANAAISYLGKRSVPVSGKYIGETEKNLSSKALQAERNGDVLLIEDYGSHTQPPTRTHHAHDRYANQDLSYLLQSLSDRRIIVVLVSNQLVKLPTSTQSQYRWIDLG
jgi:hypothetical protein